MYCLLRDDCREPCVIVFVIVLFVKLFKQSSQPVNVFFDDRPSLKKPWHSADLLSAKVHFFYLLSRFCEKYFKETKFCV